MGKTLFLFFISSFLFSCGRFTVNHQELGLAISDIDFTAIKFVSISKKETIRIVYTQLDSTPKPTIIFIHGAPGGNHNFLKYHRDSLLQKKFNLLSYHRPGYGYKDGTKAEISLQKQAETIHQIIDSLALTDIHLFTHSFGGAIGLEYASTYPTKSVVLAAAALDPDNEQYFWFSKFGKWRMTRMLLPKNYKTTGKEKYSHEEELTKLKSKLKNINTKIIAAHGDKDEMAPYINMDYIKKHLSHTDLELMTFEGANHFITNGCHKWFVNKMLTIGE